MWLLLDTDQNESTGWAGYDFIMNRVVEPGTTWLERCAGGWEWTRVRKLAMRAQGADLHLAVPRAALGLGGQGPRVAIDFKWVDHCQRPGDVMDFYVSGDAAPEGRFAFRYVAP